MRKRMPTLRFLLDRRTAGRFAEQTEGIRRGGVGLQLLNLLASSVVNPTPVLMRLVGDGFLDRQVSVFRPNQKPVLVDLPCEDAEQRDAIRRFLMALSSELAGQLTGPVIPDASTVFRAIVSEWIGTAGKNQPETLERKRQPVEVDTRIHFPHQHLRPEPAPKAPRKRPKKRKLAKKRSVDWSKPHPQFPDVSAHAIAWRPGWRGRPPKDALRNGHGEWLPPMGWRIIRGRWHPPLREAQEGKSVATPASGCSSSEGQTYAPSGGVQQTKQPEHEPPPAVHADQPRQDDGNSSLHTKTTDPEPRT